MTSYHYYGGASNAIFMAAPTTILATHMMPSTIRIVMTRPIKRTSLVKKPIVWPRIKDKASPTVSDPTLDDNLYEDSSESASEFEEQTKDSSQWSVQANAATNQLHFRYSHSRHGVLAAVVHGPGTSTIISSN